jgi:DNA mismatch repair ATPase MutL
MNDVALAYTKSFKETVEEALKTLIKITGLDTDKIDNENLKEYLEMLTQKGFKLNQIGGSVPCKTIVTITYEGELVAGFYIELDLTFNVIRRKLIENDKEFKAYLIKLKE